MTATEKKKANLDPHRIPCHVAITMDGNGRWAQTRGLDRVDGHREGSNSVRAITRSARQLGIKALTLYAFSSENWQRPAQEVAALMGLLREYLLSERAEIMDNDIRLSSIGDIGRLPAYVREPLEKLKTDSASNQGMVLSLALSYGGREEILRACRQLLQDGIDPGKLDAQTFESRLFTHHLPPLDLAIRTGGEKRVSNFLLWQAAYAEFFFTDILWPDFREEALLEALIDYQARQRRFGLTGAQISGQTPGRSLLGDHK